MFCWISISPLLADAGGGFPLGQFLPIVAMFAVIYFLILRPTQTQEKERRRRVESLKKGDQVVLAGGLLGRISNVDDPKIAVVAITDQVKVRVLKKEILDTQTEALKDPPKGGLFGSSKPSKPKEAASEDTSKADKT